MEHGRLVTSGKVDEIIDASQGNQPIHMKVVYAETEEPLDQYVATVLKEQPFVEKVSFTDDEVLIHFRGDDLEAARLLNKLFDHHIMVSHYYREKENLESLFLEITGGEENA